MWFDPAGRDRKRNQRDHVAWRVLAFSIRFECPCFAIMHGTATQKAFDPTGSSCSSYKLEST